MKAKLLWTVLFLALAGVVAWRVALRLKDRAKPAERTSEATLVRTARVGKADMADRVTFTGTVRPRNEVDIFTKVPGRIESVKVEIGDRVKSGQLLAVVEHKEIAWQARAADSAVKVARANLEGAKLDLDRTAALFKGGSAPQAQLDGARVRYALAESQVAQAEAAAGLAAQQVENASITAPIAGAVIRKAINVGNMAGPQSVLFTIQDVATLKLEASVDAAVFGRLAKGGEASVSVDALPGETFPAKVSVLSPSLDAMTRRAALELEVDNSSGKLLSNMFARAEVKVGSLPKALGLPKAAVLDAAGGAVVFRVKGERVEALKPKLGVEDGERVQVLGGLAEGDEVAVTGLPLLTDGSPVKVARD